MTAKTSAALAAGMLALAAAGGFSRENFRTPPNIHSPAYFWMWNGKLEPARLNAQVDDMFAHGMRSICIHPFPKAFRPGRFDSEMSPDYLTEDYFRVFSNVVDHAAALGMNVWLYDEGGWPSGGACGQIAADDREGRFRGYEGEHAHYRRQRCPHGKTGYLCRHLCQRRCEAAHRNP